MNLARRQALLLCAGMGGAAALAALAKPSRRADGAAKIDLDRVFPSEFGAWRADKVSAAFVRPAKQQGKRYQVYDQVLERTFVDAQGLRIMLSVAYGSEQSAGLQLHRPEVCYRAGGFEVSSTRAAVLKLDRQLLPVTRLQAELPGRPEPITYWTILGSEAVADASAFRLRRLSFAARREVLDGMLVRVSSIDPDAARAHVLQAHFADELVRAIAPQDRAKVIGIPSQG